MVKIRLRKPNKATRNNYHMQIVACDVREAREGYVLEVLGYYDPSKKPAVFDLNIDSIERWIKNGAQVTQTVKSLIKQVKKQSAKVA